MMPGRQVLQFPFADILLASLMIFSHYISEGRCKMVHVHIPALRNISNGSGDSHQFHHSACTQMITLHHGLHEGFFILSKRAELLQMTLFHLAVQKYSAAFKTVRLYLPSSQNLFFQPLAAALVIFFQRFKIHRIDIDKHINPVCHRP